MELTLILVAVIAAAVALYVVLDGFDLGVGILFPFAASERERDTMIASIAPVWDGNETWLVFAGGVLFAAFPKAYAAALPAFYVPLIALLVALIFRGAALEFRIKAERGRRLWNWAFFLGSLCAAFFQGMILGGLVQGVELWEGRFAGAVFDFLSPFSVLAGLGVAAGYALLGACWLVMKTSDELQNRARGWSRILVVAVLVAMALVITWTPLMNEEIARRWFAGWNLLWLAWMPVATALAAFLLWTGVRSGREVQPFALAIVLFLLGYFGIAYSLWPNIVPPSLSFWEAAAPRESQRFILIVAAVALPMVFVYTWYAYRCFRGKVREREGY